MPMLFAPLLLLASAADAAGPVPGTVAVALTAGAADTTDDQPYADAVGQALGEQNFTVMPGSAHGRYVAEVDVRREQRGMVTARAPKGRTDAMIGSWGPSVVMPLGTSKTQLRDLVSTTLIVRLFSRADHRLVWTGSAVTVRADGTAIPARLARAALATFPQTLASAVPVP